RIVAVIAPHAGYPYSGPIAAAAFRQIEGRKVSTVLLLGCSHRAAFRGVAVYPGDGFRTPLGVVPVDTELAGWFQKQDPRFTAPREAHDQEHSLEVELPFLQKAIPGFKIVPLLIGEVDRGARERLGEVMAEALRNDPDALVVCSTDMTHYPPYQDANRIDRETLEAIRAMDMDKVLAITAQSARSSVPNLVCTLCGENAVLATMKAASLLGAKEGTLVDYANSGDAPIGDKSRVVGYGAVVFSLPAVPTPAAGPLHSPVAMEEKMPDKNKIEEGLSPAARKRLLTIAREALNAVLNGKPLPNTGADDAELQSRRGMFVTLTKYGDLRGCMGHFDQDVPLYELAARQAVVSATEDPRFPPVSPAELKDLAIEISVLSIPQKVASCNDIVVGTHGVILRKGFRGATFLPQVAPEQGWDRDEMLTQLSLKAGLSPDAWKEGASFQVYTAQVFGEGE
ncbi:MAG: AmmeMemoRadiSam system protein B, partial [Candidatus Aureabacteria bacterium]|nr:AmmeMemoRadiSam system protein B [Candidatus Auribacterota bacterium]